MTADSPSGRAWWAADILAGPPDDAVWACARRAVTYGELRAQVASSARLAGAYGIGPGSTVALWGTASFTQLWMLLALWSVGAQVVLMEWELPGSELGQLLDRCRPQFFISFDGSARPGDGFQDECGVLVRRLTTGERARTDHCLVLFTSGSTALAKAVGKTPGSLRAEVDRFGALDGMPAAGERVLLLNRLTHFFGLVGGVFHAMSSGAVLVFPTGPDHPGSPGPVAAGAAPVAVDAVLGAPRHFAAMAAGPRPGALSGLTRAISAGDTLEPAVRERFGERFGVRVGQAYGTTETGLITADPAGAHGPDTVGVPAPGVRIRVVAGELQVWLTRSPYLAEGQYPARFAASGGGSGGWLRTRDLVARDPATGVVRLLGRFDPLLPRGARSDRHTQDQIAMRTLVQPLDRSGRALRTGPT